MKKLLVFLSIFAVLFVSTIRPLHAETPNSSFENIKLYQPIFGDLSFYGTYYSSSGTRYADLSLGSSAYLNSLDEEPYTNTWYNSVGNTNMFRQYIEYQKNDLGYYATQTFNLNASTLISTETNVESFILKNFNVIPGAEDYYSIIFDISSTGIEFSGICNIEVDYFYIYESNEYHTYYNTAVDMTESGLPRSFNLYDVLNYVTATEIVRPYYVNSLTITYEPMSGHSLSSGEHYIHTIQYQLYDEQNYISILNEVREQYVRGLAPINFTTPVTWLLDSIGSFMDFELFPNFSIGGVLSIVVGIGLFIMILKVFLGG